MGLVYVYLHLASQQGGVFTTKEGQKMATSKPLSYNGWPHNSKEHIQ